ncbi:hypothetical protein D3C75_800990 [compost metagenome]
MVQDIRVAVHYNFQTVPFAKEIRDQHLYAAERKTLADGSHCLGKNCCAAILQIITGHAGDHTMLQHHVFRCLSHTLRLLKIKLGRQACIHGTEPAGPGANIT